MVDYVLPFDWQDQQFAALYDEVPMWSVAFGKMMLDQLDLRAGMRIMDVGCGTGFLTFEMAYRCGTVCELVGVDIWAAALQRATQRRDFFNLTQIQFIQPENHHYPYPDHHFDLITSNLGINNFDAPEMVLAECKRVLKPDGQLAITTNLTGHMAEFYDVFREVLPAPYHARLDEHIAHRGTVATHQAWLERAGFQIEKVVQDQFRLRYLNGTALFQHPLIRYGFLPAWLAVVDVPDQAAVFEALAQQLNAQGELHLTIPMLYLAASP